LIHRLTYRRRNHANLHVRGYKEEGTTTTPFDMVVLNQVDRFNLVIDVVNRVDGLGARGAAVKRAMADALRRHKQYIGVHGEDLPEISGWRWDGGRGARGKRARKRKPAGEAGQKRSAAGRRR
jgi:xylulose-5-phosphate/fructose-6-phosphate phosphoketolase